MNDKDALVVITIPIYKETLTATEKASFKQIFATLLKHHICLFTFRELDLSEYKKVAEGCKYEVIYFEKKYFSNIAGYNKLLCNTLFYKTFSMFKYLLIYQLDAWVFSDDLTAWCSLDYDYVGAPWFSSDKPASGLPHFLGIGNGGFSLRKIKSHLKILNRFSYIISPAYLLNRFISEINFTTFKKLLYGVSFDNNTHHLLGKNNLYEDVFWGQVIKKHKWFKAPDMLTASRFSMESNAEKLYQINGRLPFGCHAWGTYDPDFWSTHIILNSES